MPRVEDVVRRLLKVLAGLIGLCVLLILLGTGWLVYDGHRARVSNADYVALGSSFAAGPGISHRAADAPVLCGQSSDNYAHVLARERQLRLLDRSCGGSTTTDILTGHQFFQSPQIEAVRATTRLVTITTGGNDLGYLAGLWAASCRHEPKRMPWWLGSVCRAKSTGPGDARLRALAASMDMIAKAVRRRAPGATLAFVDYTTILPNGPGCPDRLPLSDQELVQARLLSGRLAQITEQVAHSNGAILIRASPLSEGHDICAADPWAFGWVFPSSLLGFEPYAYHPTQKAMLGIAEELNDRLPRH